MAKQNKPIIFILLSASMLLILSGAASAEFEYATATVTLTIINQPPRIESLSFSSEKLYADSSASCAVEFFDEKKEEAVVHYRWMVNSEFRGREPAISGLKEGDLVECRVYVKDGEDGMSSMVALEKRVEKTSPETRLAKSAAGALGVEIAKQELEEKRASGLLSMTGFAAGESFEQKGTEGLLMILGFLVMLTMVRVHTSRSFSSKKEKSKQ